MASGVFCLSHLCSPNLLYDPLGGGCIWCVQDLSHEQWFQSPPDHARNGTGLQTLHEVVTVGR